MCLAPQGGHKKITEPRPAYSPGDAAAFVPSIRHGHASDLEKQKRPPKVGGRGLTSGNPAILPVQTPSVSGTGLGPVALRPILSDSLPCSVALACQMSCRSILLHQPYLMPGCRVKTRHHQLGAGYLKRIGASSFSSEIRRMLPGWLVRRRRSPGWRTPAMHHRLPPPTCPPALGR